MHIFDFITVLNLALNAFILFKHKVIFQEIKNLSTQTVQIVEKEVIKEITIVKEAVLHPQVNLNTEHEHDGKPSNIWKG